jgi:small subunit ribosomal protein S4e
MHQTRQEATTRLPMERKGKKYVARASSHLETSVPVVVAVRDILNLAKTKSEVKKMINQKILKINGRNVISQNESIKLFNVFEAGKTYILKLSPTRKFFLEEAKDGKERLCKVIGKTLLSGNKIQLNLHDGTNILSDNKIKINDSLYLDFSGKIKKHISLEKGNEVFIISGRYEGQSGKISDIQDKKVTIKFKEGSSTLNPKSIIML